MILLNVTRTATARTAGRKPCRPSSPAAGCSRAARVKSCRPNTPSRKDQQHGHLEVVRVGGAVAVGEKIKRCRQKKIARADHAEHFEVRQTACGPASRRIPRGRANAHHRWSAGNIRPGLPATRTHGKEQRPEERQRSPAAGRRRSGALADGLNLGANWLPLLSGGVPTSRRSSDRRQAPKSPSDWNAVAFRLPRHRRGQLPGTVESLASPEKVAAFATFDVLRDKPSPSSCPHSKLPG